MTLIVQGLTSHDLYGTDSCQKTICGGEVSKSLTFLNAILIVKMTGNLMKDILCLVDLHFSYTTLIIC